MKRLICFLTLSLAVCLSGRIAYAQHGHGAGGGVPAAAMSSHGNADAHANTGDSGKAPSTGTRAESASVQLSENKPLNAALTKALGDLVPGGNLQSACQGFTNLGRCISAIHVANNHNNINFFCLRQELTGQALPTNTGTIMCPSGTAPKGAKSLGAAIRFFDPNADSKAEATKATKQADTEIASASQRQT